MKTLLVLAVVGQLAAPAAAQTQRPMTFLDVQMLRNIGGAAVSPDKTRLLYTVSVPDWKEARRQTDIHLVSLAEGVPGTRQLTFTRDKNENAPRWTPDGTAMVFSSNRDSSGTIPPDQLYLMRTDGGEARRLTDAKGGTAEFEFTRDGKWLVYGAGKPEDRQLWALPVTALDSATPEAGDETRDAHPRLDHHPRRIADLLHGARHGRQGQRNPARKEIHRQYPQ